MSQTRAVAHNSLLVFAGRIAGLFVSVLTFKLLAIALGEGSLSDYGAVLGFLGILVPFADCGLTTICARELARDEAEGERAFREALALRLILGPLLIPVAILAAFLWYRGPDDTALRAGVAAAAFVLPLQLLTMSLSPVFQVRQKMIYPVLGDFAARAAQLAAIVSLMRAGLLGYYGALVIALGGMAINLVVNLWAARRLIRVRLCFDVARWRALLWTALPLGLSAIISSIYLRFDFLYLRSLRVPGEAGLYYVAQRAYDYSLFLPQSFITVAFPVLVGHLAANRSRACSGLQRSFDFLVMAGVPVAVGGGVLAPQVVRFLSDAPYMLAAEPLRVLLAASLFSYLASLFAYVLYALNRQRDALVAGALVLAANVSLNLYAIPRWGMLGAAWCMLTTECLSVGLLLGLVRLRYDFFPSLRALPLTLLAAAVMGAALAGLAGLGLRLWALAPIGLLLYGALAYALRLVDRETLAEILRLRPPGPPPPGGSGPSASPTADASRPQPAGAATSQP
jgi:O-antigen/teichoic acid export membrane protein